MDIIVTTPKNRIEDAEKEAEDIKRDGAGYYFRTVTRLPKSLQKGDRVFYVEDGYVRGFCKVVAIEPYGDKSCDTTGINYTGFHIIMDATSWHWIKPIEHRGFQGWRYFEPPSDLIVIGDWLSPKPRDDFH